ncbi:MAG: hypothetical protein D4R82_00810 [Dehalococcoidia bacterium]|nr:MAG: hypothetical protein D4R82_00810 [Dehalococcoidia bacterium]
MFSFPSPPGHRDCFVVGAPRKDGEVYRVLLWTGADAPAYPTSLVKTVEVGRDYFAEFTLSQRFFAAPSLHSGLWLTRMTERGSQWQEGNLHSRIKVKFLHIVWLATACYNTPRMLPVRILADARLT